MGKGRGGHGLRRDRCAAHTAGGDGGVHDGSSCRALQPLVWRSLEHDAARGNARVWCHGRDARGAIAAPPGERDGGVMAVPITRTVAELRATVAGWRKEGSRV